MSGGRRAVSDIRLLPETAADFAAIAQVVEDAFGRGDEARVVERLRASENYVPELALVAVRDGAVVGHVMFTHAPLRLADGGVRDVLILAPLSVTPAMQRSGVGGALMCRGFEVADGMGEPLIVVLGHASYYPRHGFEPAGVRGIEPPHPAMAPSFFVRPLRAYDATLRGRVEFPRAFGEE